MKIFDLSYPKSESKKEIVLSSIFIGFSAYLFLLIFQPFGTQNLSIGRLLILLLPYGFFAAVTFFSFNFYFSIKNVSWSLINELSKIILILFFCSTLNYFYNTFYLSRVKIDFTDYLFMIFYTFSIALPLCTIYVLSRFIYLNNYNSNRAEDITEKIENENIPSIVNNQLKIQDKVFNEESILFVESADNYCTVHYLENSESKRILLRSSLKLIELQIQSPKFFRCHRSYIVNFNYVSKVEGNAQGYKLLLANSEFVVPVSRKYLKIVDEIVK